MAELTEKIKKMPKFVREAMASAESAEINGQIGKKYNLSGEEIGDMVYVIAHTILKDITLKNFPRALKEKLRLSPSTAKVIALDIAIKRFLPLKKHLVGIESLITSLGGEVPKVIPKALTPEAIKPAKPSPLPPPQEPDRKAFDIKSALKENPEIEKQLIGKTPIKLEELDELVKPSIKNWLTDYTQTLGSDWHSSVERSKYLFHSPNTQNLTEKERMTLSQILKSYDEDSPLPISPETGLLLLPEPEKEEEKASPEPLGVSEVEPTPIRPPRLPERRDKPEIPSLPRSPERRDKPEVRPPEVPSEPEEVGPKIKGNVIDLKDNDR